MIGMGNSFADFFANERNKRQDICGAMYCKLCLLAAVDQQILKDAIESSKKRKRLVFFTGEIPKDVLKGARKDGLKIYKLKDHIRSAEKNFSVTEDISEVFAEVTRYEKAVFPDRTVSNTELIQTAGLSSNLESEVSIGLHDLDRVRHDTINPYHDRNEMPLYADLVDAIERIIKKDVQAAKPNKTKAHQTKGFLGIIQDKVAKITARRGGIAE